MPMRLDDGWNQIQFNLSDFTRRAYGTNYIETLRVQVGQRVGLTVKKRNESDAIHEPVWRHYLGAGGAYDRLMNDMNANKHYGPE